MNKLKEKVTSLEMDYKLSQIMQKEEAQKTNRMSERVKAMEKDLTLEKPLGKPRNYYGPISWTLSMIFGHLFKLFLSR